MIRQKKMTTLNKDGGMIYRALKDSGFNDLWAQWVTAQAAHETANFTSFIYRKNNNAFGMKFGPVHPHSAKEQNGYAYYERVPDSVAAYRDLFKSWGLVTLATVDSFVKLLRDQKYFDAPYAEYLAGVKYYLKLYFPAGKLAKTLEILGAGGTF
jgi:flagellum-specific peptidoglycan hydrolase FlgJ